MEKQVIKRVFTGSIALLCSIVIAVTALAVPAVADSVRTVTVDTDTVLREEFHGYGDNLWPGAYYYGMNDAYQTVNDMRANTLKCAYVRVLFLPHWMVDLSLPEEQQKSNWENGIYNWDNEDFKGFVRNCQTLVNAGSKILLNFAGAVPPEMVNWYGIEDVFVTEAGRRTAPKDLDSFANACAAAIQKIEELGIPVDYLTFYNEVSGGNFEAFGDKRIYWCELIKKTSLALDKAGLRSIELNKAGTRDGIYIFGTDLAGWSREGHHLITFMEYAKEHLIDKGYADGLVTHHYRSVDMDYEDVVKSISNLRSIFPDEDIMINEFSSRFAANGIGNHHSYNFKDDFAAAVITQTNEGLNGGCDWFYYGQYIPYPTNTDQYDIRICEWSSPSQGYELVGEKYAIMGLAQRYIPRISKSVKTECDSDDIIGSAYVKDEDCTVFLSVDKADSARKLKVYVGDEFIGRSFGLHVYNAPIDNDGDGDQDAIIRRADVDLLPVRIDELKVDSDGYINWDIPYGEDIRNMTVVLTTLDEQIQVQLENPELSVMPGGSVDIAVKDVFGTECEDFNFEIYDYSNANDEKEDYKFAPQNVLDSVGTLNQGASGIATFTASADLNVGDTIAIKVTPNKAMPKETAGYAIAIIRVGQYRLYFNHSPFDPTMKNVCPIANIGESVAFTSFPDLSTTASNDYADYTFEGWYLEPDFSGEKVTATDPSWNSTTYIYAKWTKKQ